MPVDQYFTLHRKCYCFTIPAHEPEVDGISGRGCRSIGRAERTPPWGVNSPDPQIEGDRYASSCGWP
ncbi:MAG: hypothetical protein WC993_04935 [Methanoculleus sp.]